MHFDEISDLEKECLAGDLDAAKFKAVLDSRKWRLARMRPKVYGDKMNVEHTGDKEKPVSIEVGVSDKVLEWEIDDKVSSVLELSSVWCAFFVIAGGATK